MISLITVNFNEMDVTVDLIKSIGAYNLDEIEIIVVDNGSKIDHTSKVKKGFPEVTVIRSEKNLGFAGGNNLGINKAQGDYLFFINNDTVFTDGTTSILQLKKVLENNPKCGVVSPLIYYFDQPDTLQYGGCTVHNPLTGRNNSTHFKEKIVPSDKREPTGFPHGAAMMLRANTIEEVGLMPENYFLYYEEIDWAFNIKKKGYQILVDHSSHILHKESLATGKISGLKTYFLTRNRILFMRRNYKKLDFFMFSLFFSFISTPTHFLRCFVNKEINNIAPFVKAIEWNLKNGIESKDLGYLRDLSKPSI